MNLPVPEIEYWGSTRFFVFCFDKELFLFLLERTGLQIQKKELPT